VVRRHRDSERTPDSHSVRGEWLGTAFYRQIQTAGAREEAENRKLIGHQELDGCVADASLTSFVG
jgi:hypothetical protein